MSQLLSDARRMDPARNISITKPAAVTDTLGDLGATAGEDRQEDPTTKNTKPYFRPWRVFINHIDSYHGKLLADVLSEADYVEPQSARAADDGPRKENDEDEKFEDKGGEQRAEAGENGERKLPSAEVSRKYEVIGTVLDREYPCPEGVTAIARGSDDRDLLLSELMSCGVIIYDITHETSQIEEACWALKEIVRALKSAEARSPKLFRQREPIRHFILISTLMTWAHTRPLDPADPSLPFTEADYRKRKPHPNYREHIRCEREVVTAKKHANLKNNLRTLVICCGVTYGEEEGPLHYLFKMAWQNAAFLPIFGGGRNKIPLLHVRDLAATVFAALQNWPAVRYIVATEPELISQRTIVKKISRGLASGKVKSLTKEEASLLPEVSQRTHELMSSLDLNIDPVYIVDRIRWHLNVPFRDALDAIVEEYRAARNLRPIRIVVLGPPASGKTRVARYLARHYGLHYVHVKTLISDTIQSLIDDIEAARSAGERRDDLEDTVEDDGDDRENRDEEEEEEAEEAEEKEVVASIAELQEQLDEIRANMAANNGRLDDIILNKLFLNRLESRDCLNQGYVMDGHPKSLEQARMLFLVSEENLWMEEEEEEEEEEKALEDEDAREGERANVTILPELVVVLEASDEFLKERVINLPEREIQNTHYAEEHMLRRLREYRERNKDDNTPLQLFDEMEIHPLVLSVEDDVCPDMFPTIYRCIEQLGEPRNYGPTAEELEARRKRTEAEARATEAAEKLRREREISERKRQREAKMMEWTSLMEKLKEEEEERLCVLAEPLRRYLTTHVFPTLTEALIEVARLRPEDPVDFLAEYLFKKNPEGRMFEPDYTETMSMLLDAIGRQKNNVLPGERLEADAEQFLTRQDELSAADETEGGAVEDVHREISATSIFEEEEEAADYKWIDIFEKAGSNLSDRMSDEFGEV